MITKASTSPTTPRHAARPSAFAPHPPIVHRGRPDVRMFAALSGRENSL